MLINKNLKDVKGFTLIELIVVMAIIAILVLLAAPKFLGYTKDANVTAMKQDVKVLSDSAELYHIDNEEWPILRDNGPLKFGIGGAEELYEVDLSKVDGVSNITPDARYGIITKGRNIGKVLSIVGVSDGKGTIYYGDTVKYLSDNGFTYQIHQSSPIYTNAEIEDMINNQGYLRISTVEDLKNIANDFNGKYVLTNHIDLKGVDFEPITQGEDENGVAIEFKGVIDGAGYTISNLKINKPNMESVGLIRRVGINGAIRNIHIVDANVVGDIRTGILAGKNSGLIENSHASGIVNGGRWVGGLIGRNNRGTIRDSSASAKVTGYDMVGGVVGQNSSNGEIHASYGKSNVKGSANVGGLTGWNGTGYIYDSYAEGLIQGVVSTGGLTGRFSRGTVKNSYSLSEVYGQGNVGLTIGYFAEKNSPQNVSNTYYYMREDTKFSQNHLLGLTEEQLKDKSSYTEWDFDNVWELTNGKNPTLKWQNK